MLTATYADQLIQTTDRDRPCIYGKHGIKPEVNCRLSKLTIISS